MKELFVHMQITENYVEIFNDEICQSQKLQAKLTTAPRLWLFVISNA